MTVPAFQIGDYVLFDGKICRVTYANVEIVVFRRVADGHLMTRLPRELAAEQVPWIQRPQGWWSHLSDVRAPQHARGD
jgi:hypothetical protein